MANRDAKWIFFDLDGTLADSVPALYAAYREFLRRQGVRANRRDFDRLNGPSLREVVEHLKEKHNLKRSVSDLFREYFDLARDFYGKAKPFEESVRLVSAFKPREIRTALVTVCPSSLAKPFLKRSGLAGKFDHVVFGDGLKKGKPDPEIYKRALEETRASARNVVAVEDSRNGVASAKAAGLYVVPAARRFSGTEEKILRFFRKKGGCHPVYRGGDIRVRTLGKKVRSPAVLPPDEFIRKRKTFSAKIFCVERLKLSAHSAELSTRCVSYFMFRRDIESGRCRQAGLAVSGITVKEEAGKKFFLVGKRSQKVTTYKGYWEFVPSGGVDASCVTGSRVDYLKKLIEELGEESGIPETRVRSVKPYLLLWDASVNVYEICCEIVLKNDPVEAYCNTPVPSYCNTSLRFNPEEYSEMEFLSAANVKKLFNQTGKKIAPTMRPMWEGRA